MRVTAVKFTMVARNPKTRLRATARVVFDNNQEVEGVMILDRKKGWDIIFPSCFHKLDRKITEKAAFVIRLSFAQELNKRTGEPHYPVRELIYDETAREAEQRETVAREMKEFRRRWHRDIKVYHPVEDWSCSE